MKLNKKLIILSIVGLVLIGIIGGASFAYFSTVNQQGEENTVKSGTMTLLFTDGQQVTATNLAPGEYIEKTFKVKNTGNVDTRYDVYFSEVLNTFVDQSDLVYTLTSTDGGYNTTSEVQVPNTETKMVNQQLVSPNEEHTYTLRITFKLKETIQNDNMGRTFTAKININEFNLNSGEHFLKLIDVSGNEVDRTMLATNQTDYTLALSTTSLTNTTNIYCNNGGIPTINGNTLNVTGVTNDTVCTISNNIKDTITNKLTTNKTGIVMTNDQSNITKMEVISGKEVVLDLNGKSINSSSVEDTNTAYVDANGVFKITGKMTINDSTGTGGIYTGVSGDTIVVSTSDNNDIAQLTINGGSFNGRSSIANGNNSYIEVNGGSFSSKYNSAIAISSGCTNNCNTVINGGSFSNGDSDRIIYMALVNNNSRLIINGGNFISNKYLTYTNANNVGTLAINGGNFEATKNNIIHYSGTITITDGSFESASEALMYIPAEGVININGGTFKSTDATINNGEGIVNINAGNIESTSNYTIYQSGGTINVDGQNAIINNGNYVSGTYIHGNGSNHAVIYEDGGHININGGTIYHGIVQDGTWRQHALRLERGTATLNGGTFTSDGSSNYCVYLNENNVVIKINGARINGKLVLNYGHSPTTAYICSGTIGSLNVKELSHAYIKTTGINWGTTPVTSNYIIYDNNTSCE